MGYNDVKVEMSLNEDNVETDELVLWVEGTVESIIEKLDVSLNEIQKHICY
jgi:hypothetical protein